jgi:hypothetical protein
MSPQVRLYSTITGGRQWSPADIIRGHQKAPEVIRSLQTILRSVPVVVRRAPVVVTGRQCKTADFNVRYFKETT